MALIDLNSIQKKSILKLVVLRTDLTAFLQISMLLGISFFSILLIKT